MEIDFESGFNNMMSSALEYEMLTRILKMDDEWTIKEWRVPSEPRVIYIKPEDVPVCLVEKDSGWKPPEDCHTKYGLLDNPWDAKWLYEYLKEIENGSGKDRQGL